MIKILETDGWYLSRTRGSHRQYKHSIKHGLVTVPGKLNDELASLTQNTSETKIMKYLIVIEKTNSGYSAYSPDIDGCVATGATKSEVEHNMREAIEYHLEGLMLENLEKPRPQSYSNYLEVST